MVRPPRLERGTPGLEVPFFFDLYPTELRARTLLLHDQDSVAECNDGIRRLFETPLVNTTAVDSSGRCNMNS
jgi:hypothetical protein